MPIRIDPDTGKPQWKGGADTWNFFSSELTLLSVDSTTVSDMSKYKYIIFLHNHSGNMVNSDGVICGSFDKGDANVHPVNGFLIIPYDVFKLGQQYTIYVEHYNNSRSLYLKYLSDTSISISGSAGGFPRHYRIYGI